jgi:general secretion pathway protein A
MARKGLFTVVIIDEAQRLSMETLEQLRLLSNLEMADRKLLQIIFVGQMELERMLEKPELRQLNQRISVRFETKPFPRKDTEEYIRHRLRIAWAIPRLQFKKAAFRAIYRHSKGYPRLINMICDRALWCAYQEESYVVTAKIVRRGLKSIKERSPGRISVWARRLLPIAGIVVLVLLIIFLLVSKNVIPSARVVSPRASPLPASAATPNEPTSRQTETPRAAAEPAVPRVGATKVTDPQPATPAETAKLPSRTRYILQTAAFRESGNAKAASEELKARGIPSFVEYHETESRRGWFVVHAGPYTDRATALQAASDLEVTLGKKPLLRRLAAK